MPATKGCLADLIVRGKAALTHCTLSKAVLSTAATQGTITLCLSVYVYLSVYGEYAACLSI